MNEIVQVEIIEPQINCNDIDAISMSLAETETTFSTTNASLDTESINEKKSNHDDLLKTLLLSSPYSSTALSAITSSTTIAPSESMITKEVNDTQLNLKKIIYEPDKEKEQEQFASNGVSNGGAADDDDRLVIDISDDEKEARKKRKHLKPKSMPLLMDSIIEMNGHRSKSRKLSNLPRR